MKTPESICQQFAGSSYTDREFKRAAAALDWNQVWPEIDRHGNLTGRLVGDEDGFCNVDDEVMISRDEARAGRWKVADGHASEPEPVAVEFAVADETIRMRAADEVIGLEHPAMQEACAAYRTAAINALRDDSRAARLEDCPPRGQRILHSQWCGAHWGYSSGAIGTMASDLTDDEKAAISAADDAGREAARKVIAEAEEPTREQIAALQGEAAAAGDDAMVAICAAALDGDPVALAAAAQCISDAAAQRDE